MNMLGLRATLMLIMAATVLTIVSANFTKDKQECQTQLVTLSSCLNYVAGEALKPSPQCCAILDEKINKTKKCLCILVKDRNEPSLGLKLNATRALRLPAICHAYNNAMECVGLLHLNPRSPEAQIFIQAANDTEVESPENSRSNGGTKTWASMGMLQAITIFWGFLSCFF